MRKIIGLLGLLGLLVSSAAGFGQTSAVTATITDTDGTAWASGPYTIQLVNSSGQPIAAGGAYRIDTGATITNSFSGTLDGSGALSVTLTTTSNINPAGTKWKFGICPNTIPAVCGGTSLAVSASGSLSSQLSASIVAPRIGGGQGTQAYADVEVATVPNNSYYNVTSAAIRCYSTSWAACGSGGGGTPGGSTTQGQFNNAGAFAGTSAETFRTADGSLSQLANVIYLSAGSDIGAQCTAAVTTLGATGGVIVFPNSTNIPMSTSCTGITQSDSFTGYGKLASIINCTFAGACFSATQNPTTNGEIGGKFSGFEINGSDAAGQILIQCVGCSGWTWDDVQFQPYGVHTATNGAVCLEFDNTGSGTFIEGNTILPSVYFERSCGPSVYLHDASADTSFAYNHFWIHLVSEGTNYGVIVDGGARVYGGMMEIFGNHVGPGGGILEFNGSSGTGGPSSLPTSAFINILAEESGSGSGVVLNANTSGTINFEGTIVNGGGGAFALATTIGGSGAAAVQMSNAYQNQGGTLPLKLYASSSAIGGVGGWAMDIVGLSTGALSGFVMDNTAQAGGHIWSNFSFTNQYAFFDQSGSGTQPLNIVSDTSAFKNLLKTGSLGQFCWGSTAQYATSNTTCDTGISRSAAGAITIGNGTQGNDSGTIDATTYKVGGVVGVTKTCTSAIVVVAGIITGCT